jgi:hypothetical protein
VNEFTLNMQTKRAPPMTAPAAGRPATPTNPAAAGAGAKA